MKITVKADCCCPADGSSWLGEGSVSTSEDVRVVSLPDIIVFSGPSKTAAGVLGVIKKIANGLKPASSTPLGRDYGDVINSTKSRLPGNVFQANGALKPGIKYEDLPCS